MLSLLYMLASSASSSSLQEHPSPYPASLNTNDSSTTTHTYPHRPSDTEVLEAFIPGYSFISRFAASYLQIDLSYYVPFIFATAVLVATLRFSSVRVLDLCKKYFVSTAEVRLDDEIYNYLMFWMARQPFAHSTTHFVAGTKTSSSMRYWDDAEDIDRSDDEAEDVGPPLDQQEQGKKKKMTGDAITGNVNGEGNGKGRKEESDTFDDYWRKTISRDKYKKLRFTPSEGTHYFRFRGRWLAFSREQDENKNKMTWLLNNERLYLSCLGRNPAILKELLAEAQQAYVERDGNRTIIYRGQKNGGYFDWVRCMARAPRPLSTVVLDTEQKEGFIDDIKDYLHPRTRRWYFIRGIPYRRGYLLHGPPGTGKTSLCFAASGVLGLKLYLLSLNSKTLDEDGLMSLFSELPRRCIVLLEDVDSAGMTQKRAEDDTDSKEEEKVTETPDKAKQTDEKDQEKGGVSLSALLNVIDGVAACEGRILVMTTNHAEKLDPALLRPGRVDMTIKFGYADSSAIQELFSSIYATLEGDLGTKTVENQKKDAGAQNGQPRASQGRIATLASEFASIIPPEEFTAAEIQGYLLKHKDEPESALKGAAEWVQSSRSKRDEKVNSSARPPADSPDRDRKGDE